MPDLKKVASRLSNIRAVEPILAALRTISLGSWQMALNRQAGLENYAARLLELLSVVLPYVENAKSGGRRFLQLKRRTLWPLKAQTSGEEKTDGNKHIVLVIGSERGLCGRYNAVLFDYLQPYLADFEGDVSLVALGARLVRSLEREKITLSEVQNLSSTALPSYSMALNWAQQWLRAYESYEIDGVDIVYNAYQGVGQYAPGVVHLLPPVLPLSQPGMPTGIVDSVIVETDPVPLYARIVEQWTTLKLYNVLLDAAASEHSTRFQLMESATKNADRLVEELTLDLQSIRRQAITREMQELAVGAGLLETH
ncbi:MAG: F0F1 ATP synthase subunit gamma [Anaerolineae bacterium]|nr:F0F1 ATP synthase subunit gamma [Anaerolineae bacterium]